MSSVFEMKALHIAAKRSAPIYPTLQSIAIGFLPVMQSSVLLRGNIVFVAAQRARIVHNAANSTAVASPLTFANCWRAAAF